jgi:hypothetical protein
MARATADATTRFFDELARRGHDPRLARASGTVGVDVRKGGARRSWRIEIAKGDIAVSRGAGPADCILRADVATFDGLATGRISPMAAVLRGAVELEGDTRLLVLFRRLLPGPRAKLTRRKR